MNDRARDANHVVIIGAGPAGLTAAYQLDKLDLSSTVLEKDPVVGGLSRTVRHNGYLFDIRRSPLLYQGGCGRTDVARGARRRPAGTRAPIENSLQGKIPRLSAQTTERSGRLGCSRLPAGTRELCQGEAVSGTRRPHLRRLDFQSIRRTSLPHVFQVLHREGVGDPL